MNVLDVAENSDAAGATLIAITLSIDTAAKRMTLSITDNGKGMAPEMVARVTDPFCTMNNVAGDPALAGLVILAGWVQNAHDAGTFRRLYRAFRR